MKAITKRMMSSAELDEKLDMISNDLLFHPHPVIECIGMDHLTACAILGVAPRTLRWYAQRGLIKRYYHDGMVTYKLTEIDCLAKWLIMQKAAKMVA